MEPCKEPTGEGDTYGGTLRWAGPPGWIHTEAE